MADAPVWYPALAAAAVVQRDASLLLLLPRCSQQKEHHCERCVLVVCAMLHRVFYKDLPPLTFCVNCYFCPSH